MWFFDLYLWAIDMWMSYKKQYEEQKKINDTLMKLIKELHESHKQIDKYVRLNEKNKQKK